MPEKKQDARVRYTKMVIRNSLLELLRIKPIAKITVTEICERADINRATFYAHYSDPSDLLHSLEAEVIEDVTRWVTPALTVVGSDLKDVLTRLVEYIGENADIALGSVGLIRKWLSDGAKKPASEIAELILKISNAGFYGI